MTVWTFYNHGTRSSSLTGPDTGEIVTLFGNNDRRPMFSGKIINEGVGSIGDPQKIAFEFSRNQGGTYFVKQTGLASGGTVARGVTAGTGSGVHDNVDNSVELVRALNLSNNKPEAINMIGWSRGAVTCIRIAWKLWQSQDPNIRDIPVNIFAVDPVAGAGHSTEVDATTVTPNVRNYFATLATGERRRFFKPIAGHRLHVADPAATRAWVVPMPGDHSDTAYNNNNIGKIVFNLAYRFLSACQTPVPAMRHYMLSNLEVWNLYEKSIIDPSTVHETSSMQKLLYGVKGYSRKDEAHSHDFGEAFFPNVHARKVFAATYPDTYDAYFSMANVNRRGTLPWGQLYSPRIVAEQHRNNMSMAMIHRLEALKQGDATAGGPAVPAEVDLLIASLKLID
ncbi:MAG TPA: hypothetical protein PKC59_00380 [Burkholderiaceae bacterium]|nr:hypothetical protein [Burkholderiaceae bacterium]HMX10141.1 hypothetical protein [Burkholderiaceae bacterium]HNB43582.1 hypothetical protein [Burkholderiaceae bacterium]HNG78761.1 hypothetical protein [Burkholderiaceae bacterium]